jgi:hypothetical protein
VGSESRENYVSPFNSLEHRSMIKGATLNYFYLAPESEIRRPADKSCDMVAGGETPFGEEFSSAPAGPEDCNVHGGSFAIGTDYPPG